MAPVVLDIGEFHESALGCLRSALLLRDKDYSLDAEAVKAPLATIFRDLGHVSPVFAGHDRV
jgi:hypothetical protein